MFSAIVFKSGLFENRSGDSQRALARRLNRDAKRRMAHPDRRLLDEKDKRMQAHPQKFER